MGYTTKFNGHIKVVPALNASEVAYLTKFSRTRRMLRRNGPYFVDGSGDYGQGRDFDIIDYNSPPEGQPELWCQWISIDSSSIEWDGGEKFYSACEWMEYLIDHFLKRGAVASQGNDPFSYFTNFTFNHVLNGTINAQGEDLDDTWRLVVLDNKVTRVDSLCDEAEVIDGDVVGVQYDLRELEVGSNEI